ncbi:MAG: c-type cytochrome biogenesis protein CcmI [bacterium]
MSLLIASLLALLIAAFFVLWPLAASRRNSGDVVTDIGAKNVELYREQLSMLAYLKEQGELDDEQLQEMDVEMRRQLLLDAGEVSEAGNAATANGRWVFAAAVFLVVTCAAFLYQQLGAAEDARIAELMDQLAAAQGDNQESARLRTEILNRIDQRAADTRAVDQGDGADQLRAEYFVVAARLTLEQQQFMQSAAWYQRALQIYGGDGELWAEYAQAVYFASGNQITPVVDDALNRALAIKPDNSTALGLRGIAAFESGNYREAMKNWQAALSQLPPQSMQAEALRSGIARAHQLAGTDGKVADGGAAQSDVAENSTGDKSDHQQYPQLTIPVDLSLDPAFTPKAGQVLFLFAREWQGPPMPLAVAKLTVADLPATIMLSDEFAMPGGRKLSSAETIELVARVSSSGNVTPSPGDLQGQTGALSMAEAAKGVVLVIDSRLE